MSISVLLLIAGGSVGALGIGSGAKGARKLFDANTQNKELQKRLEAAAEDVKENNVETINQMDSLGQVEMETLKSFSRFSDLLDQIHNRPEFDDIELSNFELPEFNPEKLEEVSTGAAALLGGASGSAAGAFAGFAAAGAVKSAIVAVGTASTGTSISALTGAALTNATLAALGGGSLAVGGGGIALGSTVLGVSTLGVGLLIGGVVFNSVGNKTLEKIEDLEKVVIDTEKDAAELNQYLAELKKLASDYETTIRNVVSVYMDYLFQLTNIVDSEGKTDWNAYTAAEKQVTENLVLLVGLLYSMCQVNLVIETEDALNTTNETEVYSMTKDANEVMEKLQRA